MAPIGYYSGSQAAAAAGSGGGGMAAAPHHYYRGAGGATGGNNKNDRWVHVSWMPHTTLSQTSHVCFSVRSAHASVDPLRRIRRSATGAGGGGGEWKVRIGAYAVGGLPLVSLPSLTPASAVRERRRRRGRKEGDDIVDAAAGAIDDRNNNDPASSAGDVASPPEQQQLRPSVSTGSGGGTTTAVNLDCIWDRFVQVPIRWRDLPRDAYLLFEIVAPAGVSDDNVNGSGGGEMVVYAATMPFFGRYGRLATGLQKLELKEPSSLLSSGDGDGGGRNYGVVPLKPRNETANEREIDDSDPEWKASCILDQLERFEEKQEARQQLVPTPPPSGHNVPSSRGGGAAAHAGTAAAAAIAAAAASRHHRHPSPPQFGQVPSVPWLDALTKRRAQEILLSGEDEKLSVDDNEPRAFLIVEFPHFDIPIMHEEAFYPTPHQGASGGVSTMDLAVYQRQQQKKNKNSKPQVDTIRSTEQDMIANFDPLELVPFLDYEDENDNPVEDKYRTLAHDLLRGLVDPALKPDRTQRDRLAAIIDSPSHHPTREEKDLLWRFRFSLVDNRRALTKFLLAVDWTVDSEVVQAAELLEQWRKRSPIDVTDALKLLGKHVAFQTNLVRTYAIETLQAAPDSELRLYLLQLVQALKYENTEMPAEHSQQAGITSVPPTSQSSSLSTFLISRATGNIGLANFLYWYLKVELNNPTHGARYQEVFGALKAKLSETPFALPGSKEAGESSSKSKSFKSIVNSVSSKFRLDCDNDSHSTRKSRSIRTMWDVLLAQDEFISGVLEIQQRCRDARGKKDAKEEQLRSLLAKEGYDRSPNRDPIPLPSFPDVFVNGVHPETAKIFKSALYPAVVDFYVTNIDAGDGQHEHLPPSCKVIVKSGDDLRQDQLIIMMIQLMDGLLKRAALDLCLTPYSILAMSPTSGLVEFVEGSVPISLVLAENNNSIMQYFRKIAPQKGTKYGVRPEVMSAYVRSLAGYCVITYILGVGDRHLDNILLRSSGHFFHIDFGFIFGRDPKPLPPAFRLTREMVDGMGGTDSTEYRQFCSLACQAFNALRKSAGLVLNLLHLMSDADIEDLSNNPSADAEGVITKVEERFRLDLNDEQAEKYFIGLINDCLAALAPRVMDVFHSFSVARR